MKLKVYVEHESRERHWTGGIETNDIEEADIVEFPGGADIDPAFYDEPVGKHTFINSYSDERDKKLFNLAIKYHKPMFGICRGAQFLCAMAGGKVIQHIIPTHPYTHVVKLNDGSIIISNSLHHQLMNPFVLPQSQYEIIGYYEHNGTYLNGYNKSVYIPYDPEIVYFPVIDAFCVQGHPEMSKGELRDFSISCIEKYLLKKIQVAFEIQGSFFKNELQTLVTR